MKIAIIGAGFCGLATAYNLSLKTGLDITLIAKEPIGGGASGIAAGLLHPYVGASSLLNWRGQEAMNATKELISIAESFLKEPVIQQNGMIRSAISNKQLFDFKSCAEKYPLDVEWISPSPEDIKKLHPLLENHFAILIKSALAIDCQSYLKGLWMACEARGVKFIEKCLKSTEEIENDPDYDLMIVAAGAGTKTIKELVDLPLRLIKGQVIQVEWPKDQLPLPFPINCQSYVIMNKNGTSCTVGSTYELKFTHENCDLNYAIAEIIPKAATFLPALKEQKVLECKTGIRVVSKHQRPYFEKISNKCWVFTGMGSKGLLYHALIAKEVADQVS